ncbi:Uncharacterized protein GBIM_06968 [Gryllus bimaculatus]|nr:Uncharacterized protein GBIM_06968 [Gryllus bimaculatus]
MIISTMWSGDANYSQWALNPSAYQNVSHEEVDWAALAQQWIQMKETHPNEQIPPAPPPPPLGDTRITSEKKKDEVEGGEAPMDMDSKEDMDNSNASSSQDASSWGAWSNWQQWGWSWGASGGIVPPGGVPPPNSTAVPAGKAPPAAGATTAASAAAAAGGATPSAVTATATPTAAGPPPVPPFGFPPNAQPFPAGPGGVFDYNHSTGSEPFNQVMAGGYWSGPSDGSAVPPVPGGGPAPFIRHNRHDWKRTGRSHDRTRPTDKSDEEEDTTTVIDAAKRRQLPAWIREGLEKMEREKQKKLDRERQIKEREEYLQKKREEEESALNELENSTGQPVIPKKSKFESDSEESGHEENTTSSQTSKRKSRFRNVDSPSSSPPRSRHVPVADAEPVKSREEILQEMMLKVRRTLTEILLEVTTEEMEAVANEVLSKARAKGTSLLRVYIQNIMSWISKVQSKRNRYSYIVPAVT